MDKKLFLNEMKKLGAAHQDFNLTKETLAIYWEDLQHLSPQDWVMATTLCRRTIDWFPKPSQILRAVKSFRPSAHEAWAWLLGAAATGILPEMDEPTRKAMEAAGGWENLQFTAIDDLSFRFKDFKAVYERTQDIQGVKELAGVEQKMVEG